MQSEFILTTPFDYSIEKKNGEEEVHLDGFVSTTDLDLVQDVVTKKCLESMKKQILEKNLKLDVEHEAFRGKTTEEKEINKTKVPIGRMYDAAVESIEKSSFGLRVKSVLNNFSSRFKEAKGSIVNKFLDAYSIAFIPKEVSYKNVDGKRVRLLDDVVLLNVALTGNPINTTAQNRDIFMKAINSIEDYKQEKKDDPELEKQLVIKSKEEKSKCTCGYSDVATNHNHLSDTKLNQGGKIMENKDEGNAEGTQDQTQDQGQEEGQSEAEQSEVKSLTEEVKSLKGELEEVKAESEKLKAENSELKAKLKEPVHKSVQEQMKEVPENKSIGPLDSLR